MTSTMFRERLALRICRILGVVELRESLTGRVDHRDLTLGDTRDEQVVLKPDPDDRVSGHEVTLKAPADDLREAARYMRASLCYGGSADPFYSTIADWFDREAGHAERLFEPGFWGVADDLAVKAARSYLPGARAWLHKGDASCP